MKYLKLFDAHSNYDTFVSGGTMVRPNVSHCVQENDVHYNPLKHDYSKDYLTIESLEDNNQIRWDATSSDIRKTISASTDNGQTWTAFTASYCDNPMAECLPTTIATLNVGEKVLVKGENESYAYSRRTNSFRISNRVNISGNIMSLIYGDSFENNNTLTESTCFASLFSNCNVVSAENLILPATTLTDSCYSYMFYGCTSLTVAPELPATTLAEGCYDSMFIGCTSLTVAPELPATTLAYQCYAYMFQGCTSLTSAPELPATTLTNECYSSMFQDCTSLTTAPELPATTLIRNCYWLMFNGCTSLNYIKAMFTTTPSSMYTGNWVSGVAASGTFVKNSAAQWDVTGADGIPTGWTVQNAS